MPAAPAVKTPFQQTMDGGCPRTEAPSGLPAARQFFSMAFSLGSDRPFPELWPLPSRGRIDHLVNEALGSKFLQPRSQMQLVGILCKTLIFKFWISLQIFERERLHVKIYWLLNIQISGYPEPITAMAAGSELPSPLPKRQVSPGTPDCTTSFPGGPAALGGWIFHPAGKFHVWATSCSLPTLPGPSFLLPLAVGTSAHIPVPSAPALIWAQQVGF